MEPPQTVSFLLTNKLFKKKIILNVHLLMVNLSEEEIAMLDVSWAIAKENLDLNLTCIEALISNSRRISGLKKMNRAVLAQEANLDAVEYMCEKEAYNDSSQEYNGFKYTRGQDQMKDRFNDFRQNEQPSRYQFDNPRRTHLFNG